MFDTMWQFYLLTLQGCEKEEILSEGEQQKMNLVLMWQSQGVLGDGVVLGTL